MSNTEVEGWLRETLLCWKYPKWTILYKWFITAKSNETC